jgi:hypothetical protein
MASFTLFEKFGGRRNTMVWAAFIVSCACLFVMRGGEPIATFSEWTVFVLANTALLVAGIVTQKKNDGAPR